MNRFDIYILNKKKINNLIKAKGNKKLACEFIEQQTILKFNMIYGKHGICNPKNRTIPYAIACGLLTHREDPDIDEFFDFSGFVLDVRRLIVLMNSTSEALFLSNEKAVLSIMLLYYETQEWWTAEEIVSKAKLAGSNILDIPAINEVLENGNPENTKKKKTKSHLLFEKDKDSNRYRMDIDRIVAHLKDSKSVSPTAPEILT